MWRRRQLGLLLLAGLTSCSSCEPDSATTEAPADGATRAATARVVSLSPSTTEAMFTLGVGDRLVGRSAQCDRPPEVATLPSVGGFADPNVERVLTLQPTLVIGSQSPAGPELREQLKAHGIETFFPPTRSVGEVTNMLLELGRRLERETEAQTAVMEIEARLEKIERWAAEQGPVSVVFVLDKSPIYVAGPGSYADELIRRAGGRNVIDRGGQWPTIDLERLLVLDPDVIIDAMGVGHGDSSLASATGWEVLRAVEEGRVRRLASDAALRPGPRLAAGLHDIATALHGQPPPK